jgi:ribosomal protein L37AE/L43A
MLKEREICPFCGSFDIRRAGEKDVVCRDCGYITSKYYHPYEITTKRIFIGIGFIFGIGIGFFIMKLLELV